MNTTTVSFFCKKKLKSCGTGLKRLVITNKYSVLFLHPPRAHKLNAVPDSAESNI